MTSLLPAHDLDAERAVLATVYAQPERLGDLEGLLAEAFYDPRHGWQWRAILALAEAGQPIDAITVAGWLKARSRLLDAGGVPYLGDVCDAVPVVHNVSAYGALVVGHWRQRKAVAELEVILAKVRTGQAQPDDLVRSASVLTGLGESRSRRRCDDLLPVLYAEDLDAPMQPFPWLIESLGMMRGRPLILSGYGDAGKTFAAQELMLAVARGDRMVWGSLAVDLEGPVVHIDLEQQLEMTRWRYRRLAFGKGYRLSSLGRRLELSSLPPMKLTDPDAKQALIERCTNKALCLIDNLTAGTPGLDENSKAMAAPLYMLNDVSAATGCTILLIHHEGKTGELPKSAAQRIRGHSSIHGALGGGVSFTKQADGSIKIEQAKASMGQGEPVYFRFEDRGNIEPATKKSEGIELVWMPLEQMAQAVACATSDAERVARERVLTAVTKHGPKPKSELIELVKGNLATKREALRQLLAEGLLVTVGGPRGAKLVGYPEQRDASE